MIKGVRDNMEKKMLCIEIGSQIAKVYFISYTKRKSQIDAYFQFDTPEDIVYDGAICNAVVFSRLLEDNMKKNCMILNSKLSNKKFIFFKNLTLEKLQKSAYKDMAFLVHSTKIIAKNDTIVSTRNANNRKTKQEIIKSFPVNKKMYSVFVEQDRKKLDKEEKKNGEKPYSLTAVPKKILEECNEVSRKLNLRFAGINVVENMYDSDFARRYKNITIIDIGMKKTVFIDVKNKEIVKKKVIMQGISEVVNSLIKHEVFGEYDEGSCCRILEKIKRRDCLNHGTDGEYEEDYKDLVIRKIQLLLNEIQDVLKELNFDKREDRKIFITGVGSKMCGIEKFMSKILEADVKSVHEGVLYIEEGKLMDLEGDEKTPVIKNIHSNTSFVRTLLFG